MPSPGDQPSIALSILVPCFNEQHRLHDTVREILAFADQRTTPTELILIDDGSSDGTPALIDRMSAGDARVRGIRLPANRGKGAALREGAGASRGELVAFLDADLSYPLASLDVAEAEIRAGADVVIGGRDLDASEALRSYSVARRVSSVAFNVLVDGLLGLKIPDTQCGFKVFRGPAARALFRAGRVDRFGFDVELLFLAKRWGLRIKRIPVRMTHRKGSTVSVVRDAPRMAYDVWRIRAASVAGEYPRTMPQGSPTAALD